jgi:hypothetical protein
MTYLGSGITDSCLITLARPAAMVRASFNLQNSNVLNTKGLMLAYVKISPVGVLPANLTDGSADFIRY